MTRLLIRFLCAFIPVRAWRKMIRQRFPTVNHHKRMRRFHRIADWNIEKVDGVKVATGVLRDGSTIRLGHVFSKDRFAIFNTNEIFNDNEYHFFGRKEAVVIDIGMNYGYASLYFALCDNVKAVYAFEPVKSIYEKALFNFSLNECGVRRKIIAANFGLGDGDKQVTVNYDPVRSGVTSIIPQHQSVGKIKLSVQIKDAASVIRDIIAKHPGNMLVIKSDCEGTEKEIFERLDAENILPSINAVIMEYHYGQNRFIEPILVKNEFVYFKDINDSHEGIIRAVNSNHSHDAFSGRR